MVVSSPFEKLNLRDEHRLQPSAFLHLGLDAMLERAKQKRVNLRAQGVLRPYLRVSMEHQLAFSKIHIIEWLRKVDPKTGEPDRRTGQEICKELQTMLAAAKSPIQVLLHRVGSRAALLARLKRIEEDFENTKRYPLIQVETHGNDDGIGLSAEDALSWTELMKALTPLNEATGLLLPVFLSACHGMWGIRMAQAMQPAPFFALMGPKKKVYPGEIVRGMCAFYRKAIVERNGLKAMQVHERHRESG